MYWKSNYFKWLVIFLGVFVTAISVNSMISKTLLGEQHAWLEKILFLSITVGLLAMIGFIVLLVISGKKFAPKPFNHFTPWVAVVFASTVVFHLIGQDDKLIVTTVFGLDILYRALLNQSWAWDGDVLSALGLIMRVVVGAMYGLVLDIGLYMYKKWMK